VQNTQTPTVRRHVPRATRRCGFLGRFMGIRSRWGDQQRSGCSRQCSHARSRQHLRRLYTDESWGMPETIVRLSLRVHRCSTHSCALILGRNSPGAVLRNAAGCAAAMQPRAVRTSDPSEVAEATGPAPTPLTLALAQATTLAQTLGCCGQPGVRVRVSSVGGHFRLHFPHQRFPGSAATGASNGTSGSVVR
jgi:hypothetical protein